MHIICIFALAIGYTLFSTPTTDASPMVSKSSCNKSNLNKIKKNAVELQRKRELNSYLNKKQLTDRQKNMIRSKIPTTSLTNLVRMANNFEKRGRT